MVFKTSQMPLLTALAKAREKKEVRRTAMLSALCKETLGRLPAAAIRRVDSDAVRIGQPDGPAPTATRPLVDAPCGCHDAAANTFFF
jgi:hypothetical protein